MRWCDPDTAERNGGGSGSLSRVIERTTVARRLTTEQARLLAAAVLGIGMDTSLEVARQAYVRQLARTASAADLCQDTLASVQFAWAVWQALDSLADRAEIVLADDLVVVIPDHRPVTGTYGPGRGPVAPTPEHLRGQQVDTFA